MSEPRYDPIPETCEEALRKWDADESVFTAEMGGLGPGYEQCIHIMAFDIVRAHVGKPLPEDADVLRASFDAAIEENASRLGVSGAQAGAAMNLAAQVLRKGWRAALRELPEDRLIQVRREFPSDTPRADHEFLEWTEPTMGGVLLNRKNPLCKLCGKPRSPHPRLETARVDHAFVSHACGDERLCTHYRKCHAITVNGLCREPMEAHIIGEG